MANVKDLFNVKTDIDEAKAISHYNTNKILNNVTPKNIDTIWENTSSSYISADESIRNKINDINAYKSRYHI